MDKVYDISMLINEDIIVYPGSKNVVIEQQASIPQNNVNDSVISMGCHTGTHVDSQFHISNDGKKANELLLDTFYGKCKVLDLTHLDLEIHKEDLEKFDIDENDIILLKTQNSEAGYNEFNKNFVHLKLDAAQYLVDRKIKTLGCDYLSVKKFGGDDEVHEITINNMTLFEGLNLNGVPGGEYLFMGLPIKLECDGAPARVIIVKE
jgi:arylformamidase